jgi:hypothetical protein
VRAEADDATGKDLELHIDADTGEVGVRRGIEPAVAGKACETKAKPR